MDRTFVRNIFIYLNFYISFVEVSILLTERVPSYVHSTNSRVILCRAIFLRIARWNNWMNLSAFGEMKIAKTGKCILLNIRIVCYIGYDAEAINLPSVKFLQVSRRSDRVTCNYSLQCEITKSSKVLGRNQNARIVL